MRKKIGIICLICAFILTILMVALYGKHFLDYIKSDIEYQKIEDANTSDGEDSDEVEALLLGIDHVKNEYAPIDVDSENLLKQNKDYIGWIYVPKTDISYPVVKSSDNEDYLHVDFNKNYSFPGTIFMDCRCDDELLNHHIVLYGHNMNNGSMFAGLKSFRDQSYVDEHPVFWFITPEEKLLYKIFSVCNADPYDRKQYGIDGDDFKTTEEFASAIKYMKDNSVVKIDTDEVEDTDYIMSLSTCTGNSSVRCIVHGVQIGSLSCN